MMFGRRLAVAALSLAAVSLARAEVPADNLNLRFANGIAAIAEEKVITVDDVRREISPLIPQLQREARSEKEFNEKLEALQDDVIQQLIDRVLIVKEFRKDEKKHIPMSFIDNRIADIQAEQFDNDRSKFLAYLRSRSMTLQDYRREVEEDIIYSYMRGQQRKSQSLVSPVRIETFYRENKDRFYQEDGVHLRLIQFTRTNGETDADLMTKAKLVQARLAAGEKFEDLAKEYSQDSRRAKGGDWGWQKRSDLKPAFSDPLFMLKKGETTEPILTPEGCFLLHVDDRKYAGIQPLDDVRDQIERILLQQMAQVSQERWLERLRRNGYVKHY
ncbi:MAG: peptidyl-prolyl cis-trans isomerase [Verrucomicrobia bacterium]|nr:peptidyl-prolyl cis-trans isomerase [Verrucomicrobiota bacterium]